MIQPRFKSWWYRIASVWASKGYYGAIFQLYGHSKFSLSVIHWKWFGLGKNRRIGFIRYHQYCVYRGPCSLIVSWAIISLRSVITAIRNPGRVFFRETDHGPDCFERRKITCRVIPINYFFGEKTSLKSVVQNQSGKEVDPDFEPLQQSTGDFCWVESSLQVEYHRLSEIYEI